MKISPAIMGSIVSKEHAVCADHVRIGKDVIELLTSGMYVSPVSIFREYVQNAADSLDAMPDTADRTVSVDFNHETRSVVIRDGGMGIRSGDVADILLAIGGSSKRGTSLRGFRGVGRLSGLAYCRELEFRTKAAGEKVVSSLKWDCRRLREMLTSRAPLTELQEIVSAVVTVNTHATDNLAEHFFEVRLTEVMRLRSDMLLNEHLLSSYLGQVAPVPFHPEFSLAPTIQAELARHGSRNPIRLMVGGEQVFRSFRDVNGQAGSEKKITISSVEFFKIADVDGEVGAIGWIGHHEYVRSISSLLGIRGLRARVGDLQVGEANLFDECFKEPRFNGWTIGEIHVLDRRVVPNARRDNFEANHHFANLLVQLGPVAAKIAARCRTSSISRTAAQTVQNAIDEVEQRLRDEKRIVRSDLSKLKASLIRAEAKTKQIDDEKSKAKLSAKLSKLQQKLSNVTPRRGPAVMAFSEASRLISKFVTNRAQADKLLQELRKICD
jgi:Histidine kinase-, DNA gyrase B-, and HSP90-like ATPase